MMRMSTPVYPRAFRHCQNLRGIAQLEVDDVGEGGRQLLTLPRPQATLGEQFPRLDKKREKAVQQSCRAAPRSAIGGP